MDYNTLNNLLKSLEIKDKTSLENNNLESSNKNNINILERELNLKTNYKSNMELENPQRQNINTDVQKTNSINDTISQYNFVQTKKYDQNIEINFKQIM